MEDLTEKIKFDEKGLIPAVVQDSKSGQVLMVAYMNKESLNKTIEGGKACFWSRSRKELWVKGETSGNYQYVEELRLDCDGDTLLLRVNPAGPACHTGNRSCFFRTLYQNEDLGEIKLKEDTGESKTGDENDSNKIFINKALFLKELAGVITDRWENPREGSYTNYLLEEGVDKVCKKIGEEAAEVIIGAKNESPEEIIYESGDLIFHLLVLFNIYNISLEALFSELEKRHK
ncbi:MAG TPA: bifunctional phosphoribosyl-AMP cyclohydrolase/phosphoribosyl-ATP diphosphatase HisIE [Halanaerobiales bacterium]|nr:bifunctional phosphoribosyl-AMP cyclohydrolase/phosphoribosyl-ATP diphosphatase HisIE [Halanaerobiales bacterium]